MSERHKTGFTSSKNLFDFLRSYKKRQMRYRKYVFPNNIFISMHIGLIVHFEGNFQHVLLLFRYHSFSINHILKICLKKKQIE